MRRRFQVFVSSTYEDLLLERQAAVEAILKAGHIPAGMELFTAGDKSQMDVIRRWIDESDLFMLILGARYGSIEPTSQKSYIELEFDYAIETGKPFFAVVLSDTGREAKVKERGTSVLESSNEEAYRSFRKRVLSQLCAFFDTAKDVKLAIFETLPQITLGRELRGWVSTTEIQSPNEIAKELARLSQENAKLRVENEQLHNRIASLTGNGPSFEELRDVLQKTEIRLPSFLAKLLEDEEKDPKRSLLQLALFYVDDLARSVTNAYGASEAESFVFHKIAAPLAAYGLVEHGKTPASVQWSRLKLSKDGTRFFTKAQLWFQGLVDKASSKGNEIAGAEMPKDKVSKPRAAKRKSVRRRTQK